MKKLTIEYPARELKDTHTVGQCGKSYRDENLTWSKIEEGIFLRYNKKTEGKLYHVKMYRNGNKYQKTYRSLEQARIFKKTILENT